MKSKRSNIITMRPEKTFFYDGFVNFVHYLKQNNVKKILEIGSYIGESASLFKEILGHDTIVISIDPWKDMPDDNDLLQDQDFTVIEQEYNTQLLKYDNYGKLKFYSQDICDMFSDNYFDCIYIDGLHTYKQVKSDIKNYTRKVRGNGFISGHDYDIPITQNQLDVLFDVEANKALRKEVTRAIHEEFNSNDIVTFEDSSWLIKK